MSGFFAGGGSAATLPKYMADYHRSAIIESTNVPTSGDPLLIYNLTDQTTQSVSNPTLYNLVRFILINRDSSDYNPYVLSDAFLETNLYDKFFNPNKDDSLLSSHKSRLGIRWY